MLYVKRKKNTSCTSNKTLKTRVNPNVRQISLVFYTIIIYNIGPIVLQVAACVDARKEYDDMENETLFSLLDVVLNNQLNSDAADAQLLGVFQVELSRMLYLYVITRLWYA